MESEVPDAKRDSLEAVKQSLRELIHWRDWLAAELVKIDAVIAMDARAFADLNGDKAKPTLEQLRRMVADENGKG